MKKIIAGVLIASSICVGLIIVYSNNSNIKPIQANQPELVETSKGSIDNIKNLTELKNKAKVIAEVEGTGKIEKRDYKGLPCTISTVKVKEILKGDKSLKEIKILQVENVDTPPQNGQKLLIFLSKDTDEYGNEDNPDCYGVVGAGQGIYILDDSTTKGINSAVKSEGIVKPQAIENKDILKELSGKYEDIKNKLK